MPVNIIETKRVPTLEDPEGRCLSILIDGTPLDHMVQSAVTDTAIEGMTPFPSSFLEEGRLSVLCGTWVPQNGQTGLAPILLCPDCCDLYCNVIVADVRADKHVVHWLRLGLDKSSYKSIGRGVERASEEALSGRHIVWLDQFPPLAFDRTAYEACLAALLADRGNMLTPA